MSTLANKSQENQSQAVSAESSQVQIGSESSFQFVDNRPETIAQRKLQEMGNNSAQVSQLMVFQEMANKIPKVKQAAQLQNIADNYSAQRYRPIQKKENKTGLPDNLKSGIENLSGYSMNDVKVHYNSDKPAQLQAHAYAQGTDIHLGSGQEEHLPHETWHIVQQKQGRVKPTLQMKGKIDINDNAGLEKEADVMGEKALNWQNHKDESSIQRKKNIKNKFNETNPIQMKGEASFIQDPAAFMESNQLLVNFGAGIKDTYSISEADIEKIIARQIEIKAEVRAKNPDAGADLTSTPTIKRKAEEYLIHLYAEAMKIVKPSLFTLAQRQISTGILSSRGQYVVTPMLEALPPAIDGEIEVVGPDGLTKVKLKDALKAVKRNSSQPYDAVISAALIPYESNASDVTEETRADIPTGDVNPNLKIAFTAGMNGCSLAVKKKSETELSVWHYPSPDSNEDLWRSFKEDKDIKDTYDWNEYNEESETPTEHVTTTVLIRDGDGEWNVKSQQSRGPIKGGDLALQAGKVYGRKLNVGDTELVK